MRKRRDGIGRICRWDGGYIGKICSEDKYKEGEGRKTVCGGWGESRWERRQEDSGDLSTGARVAGNRVDRERADEARTILHPQSTV